jgi:ATP-dependent DNA helicase RecQ
MAKDPHEVSLIVRKALSGVARVHGRFGLGAAVALLRGVADERLARAGLNRTSTFGVLSDFSEDWLTRLLRRCVTAGWVDFSGGDRPVVILTDQGVAVMKDEVPVRLLLPPLQRVGGGGVRGRRTRGGTAAPDPEALDPGAIGLFEALRQHRLEVARAEGVPPYVVASDRTLREIALLRPADLSALELAHGIGPSKAEKYGDGLLTVIREHG